MDTQNYSIEEEIDLRAYVEVLIRYWKWIVGYMLVAALTAFTISSLRPPIYEAETTVAIIRSRTDVIFAPQMVTTEDQLTHYLDKNARRTALVELVSSSDIAIQVLNEVGAQLELDELTAPGLLGMIEASNEGDLIVFVYRGTISLL